MNIMSMDIILIFVIAVICAGLVKGTCPSTCSCADDSSGSRINCNSKFLGSIPALLNDTYYLYISYNLIIEIPENTFVDCEHGEQLYYIELQYNKIRSIESNTIVNMTNLYYLSLHNNEIYVIEPFTFVDLPNLNYLHIQRNKIRSLESNTFVNMTNLYYLYLQHNEISVIEPFTFVNLPNLYRLFLNGNNISHIEEHAFGNLTSLTWLGLSGNPLNCDCSIFSFWSWLIERSSIGTNAKCSNGTLVTSLQTAALEACYPDNCLQCFNGGKCVAMGYTLICECIGQWTGKFCQESQCTSYDCGFGDCYIEPVNGTAQCLCDDRYVNFCPGAACKDRPPTARDCDDVESQGYTCSGVYSITLVPGSSVNVLCDLQTAGGRWTHRKDGSVNFDMNWFSYKYGFGDAYTEVWLGNDNLYRLTSSRKTEMLILMEAWDGVWKYASYSEFYINSEFDKYRIRVSGFSGTAGDSLMHMMPSPQGGQLFSTRDSDNDGWPNSCNPTHHKAGFLFNKCGASDLNGHYYSSAVDIPASCNWFTFSNNRQSLKTIFMMVRKL